MGGRGVVWGRGGGGKGWGGGGGEELSDELLMCTQARVHRQPASRM